ncbi:hypothetical protein M2281_002444 [Mesorhizobium soli]|nr:hypothetical protein [Mesorhizobium soli]
MAAITNWMPESCRPVSGPQANLGRLLVLLLANCGQRRNIMGLSQHDPAAQARRAWNAGRKVGAKRALKPRQVWAIRFFLDRERRMRDRALFDLAIDSKLRGCDLVKIKIGTLVVGPRDGLSGSPRGHHWWTADMSAPMDAGLPIMCPSTKLQRPLRRAGAWDRRDRLPLARRPRQHRWRA